MKTLNSPMPRRTRCGLVGRRAAFLTPEQMEYAWMSVALALIGLENRDVPKFDDLLKAIRKATIVGRNGF